MKKTIFTFLLVLTFFMARPTFGLPPFGALVEKAPDFTLNDLQGKPFKLSEQRGKPVLIVFGTTWCPYCRDEIPRLKNIFQTYGKKGLVLINIDIQEPRDKVKRFAEKHRLPYRVLLDERAEVAKKYGIQGVPTFVLIDVNGLIVCQQCISIEPLIEKTLKMK